MNNELNDVILSDASHWPIGTADAHRMLNLPSHVEYPTAENKYLVALGIIRHLMKQRETVKSLSMDKKLREAARALYNECVIIRQHPERHLHPHVDTMRNMEAALREASAEGCTHLDPEKTFPGERCPICGGEDMDCNWGDPNHPRKLQHEAKTHPASPPKESPVYFRCEGCRKIINGRIHRTSDDVDLCEKCWHEVVDAEKSPPKEIVVDGAIEAAESIDDDAPLQEERRELGEDEIIDKLADYSHRAWSEWMKYMFSKGKFEAHEYHKNIIELCYIMPADLRFRWERQMRTEYADLPEEEKATDRHEARKILEVYRPAPAQGEEKDVYIRADVLRERCKTEAALSALRQAREALDKLADAANKDHDFSKSSMECAVCKALHVTWDTIRAIDKVLGGEK